MYGVFSTVILRPGRLSLLPEQQHTESTQKRPAAMEKAVASHVTAIMRPPIEALMLYALKTELKTPTRVPYSAVEVMEAAMVKMVATCRNCVSKNVECFGRWLTGTYRSDDRSDEATPTREDCEDTEEDLGERSKEGDSVSGEHPVGDLLVDLEPVLQLVRDQVLGAGLVESPDLDGVEPERRLAAGAVGNPVTASRVVITRAVVPDANSVRVAQVVVRTGSEGGEQVIVDVGAGDVYRR